MLIAPIFQHSYLSPGSSSSVTQLSKPSDTTSSASAKSSESSSSKYNNIFKTAFNRGTELIKNTFLTKITTPSSNNSPGSSSSSALSKPADIEVIHDSDSSPSTTPSEASSADSLQSELIFFKPIIREPRTPLQTYAARPVLLRVPSIRSVSSSADPIISSPCPSPFFIPIAPRDSAFSVVGLLGENEPLSNVVIKPKATKRKALKASPESARTGKRMKQEIRIQKKEASVQKPTQATRRLRQVAMLVDEPEMIKTEPKYVRRTRSMGIIIHNNNEEVALSTKVKPIPACKEFKSPTKIPARKRTSNPPVAKKSPKKTILPAPEIEPMITRSRRRVETMKAILY